MSCCGNGRGYPSAPNLGYTAASSGPFNTRAAASLQPVCHNDPNVSNHVLHAHGSSPKRVGHADTYFNDAGCELFSRYAPKDWEESNQSKYALSEKERNQSQRIRTDAWQSMKQTDADTRCRQAQNTQKLAKRRDDIAFWKSELVCEVRKMCNETENLSEHTRVLNKAYQDTKQPLAIALDCLQARECRQGIDRVADGVECALTKEIKTIRSCQEKMRALLQKADAQLCKNRAAQGACDADARDKHHAQDLDDRVHQLNTAHCNNLYPGVDAQDNTITNRVSWVRYTQTNIERSQKQRELSEKLRGHIDDVLRACATQMWTRFNDVNTQLHARIQEVTDARNKLQAHLQRVCNELAEVCRSAEQIRRALSAQCDALRLAQTRLQQRQCRINVEICHDSPMKGLIREVREIEDSIKRLELKLKDAEQTICRLEKTKCALEQDIHIKENSLAIDSRVAGMRKNMALDPTVGPIFNMPLFNAC